MSSTEVDKKGQSVIAKTFMTWINISIGRKVFKRNNLYEELENGVILIELLESLTPDQEMPGRYVFESKD